MKAIILFFILVHSVVFAKTIYKGELYGEKYKIEHVASGLSIPWGIELIDEDRLIITQKSGEIVLINLKNKTIKNLNNPLYIRNEGQGGLLDVALSPNFARDKTIYFSYVKSVRGDGLTTIAKAIFENNELKEFQEVFESKSLSDTNRHFGSRITFDKSGNLYFSVGDRGVRKNAQDTNNHAGSILRINTNAKAPKDNPFIDNNNILDEIYSLGHRNPQGLFYDTKRDILWSIEHGPRGGDEINIIKKGRNYGWPIVSHGKEYFSGLPVSQYTSKKGMEDPFKVYIPSIAPSSLIVYSGKKFVFWSGFLFAGALKLQHINIINIDKNLNQIEEKRIAKNLRERVRDITESPAGYIYFTTDSGNIYKISPQ